jgi:hypothetical protein
MRPGELPQWLEVPLTEDIQQRWRDAARQAQLPVDVWVSLLLEHAPLVEELSDLYSPVLEEAAHSLQTPRLTIDDTRKLWIRQLREGSVCEHDELPSLALPSRVLACIWPSERTDRLLAIEHGDIDAAKVLDAAAAIEGFTMEAWAYRRALRLAKR